MLVTVVTHNQITPLLDAHLIGEAALEHHGKFISDMRMMSDLAARLDLEQRHMRSIAILAQIDRAH